MKKPANKHLILALALLLVASTVAFLWWKGSRVRSYETIARKGVLRVAIGYNATDYYLDGDTAAGFQYQLVQALCHSLHLTPQLVVQNSLDESIESLLAGKVDLVARNVPVTVELRERVLFLHDLLQAPQVLVQRRAEYNNGIEPIRSQLLLGGQTVYLPENSPNLMRLANLSDEIADTIRVVEKSLYDVEQLLMLVAHGDIDFTVCDLPTARQNAALLPELDIETAVSFPQMQAWAVHPAAHDLKLRVDSFLTHFLQTREYRDIYREYYR